MRKQPAHVRVSDAGRRAWCHLWSAVLAWSLAAPLVSSAAADFLVGSASADITPPVGWRKAGGYDEVISKGVHDPLFAKALVFEQGGERAALVVCDLTGMSRPVCDRARAEASRLTGIPVAHIAVSATHTHGGPEFHGVLWDIWRARTIREKGRDDTAPFDYQDLLAVRITTAITDAWAARRPVTLSAGVATKPGLAFNRRYHMKDGTVRFNPGKQNPDIVAPAGPTDDALPIVLFRDAATGVPRASLSSFAMHVATFGHNDEFGADFPAVLQDDLRTKFGPGFFSLFGEGCAGDVNHVDVRSDVPQPGDTEPLRIGHALAATFLAKLPELGSVVSPSLAVRSEKVPVPLQEISPEQVTRASKVLANELTSTPAFMLQVEAYRVLNARLIRERHGDSIPMEVQAFRLAADTAVVTLPHEVFVELGLAIKAASPFAHTQVISIANDVDWYVPTRKAFAEGSYEVTTCPVKPGVGETLVATAVKLLNQLKP